MQHPDEFRDDAVRYFSAVKFGDARMASPDPVFADKPEDAGPAEWLECERGRAEVHTTAAKLLAFWWSAFVRTTRKIHRHGTELKQAEFAKLSGLSAKRVSELAKSGVAMTIAEAPIARKTAARARPATLPLRSWSPHPKTSGLIILCATSANDAKKSTVLVARKNIVRAGEHSSP